MFSITLDFYLRTFAHLSQNLLVPQLVIVSLIVFANHVLHTTQAPTVFVNHVVPLQHTDTGRKTDFRRKVTPKIGVTTKNSCYLAHNQIQSPKLTPRQLRNKLPDSFNINHKLFQICKEDGMTIHTELRGRHTYMLNAKNKTRRCLKTSR